MPHRKRHKILHERLKKDLLPLFAGRVLPSDRETSRAYTGLMSKAKAAGRAIKRADGSIAAITTARSLSVAPRVTAPFHPAGIPTINPWAA